MKRTQLFGVVAVFFEDPTAEQGGASFFVEALPAKCNRSLAAGVFGLRLWFRLGFGDDVFPQGNAFPIQPSAQSVLGKSCSSSGMLLSRPGWSQENAFRQHEELGPGSKAVLGINSSDASHERLSPHDPGRLWDVLQGP